MSNTPRTIYNYYARQRKHTPRAVAVVDERRILNFTQLEQLADAVISNFPVEHPARIGVIMDHSALMIATLLATAKSGAAYVPIEPGFPPERIRFILDETKVDFVVTDLSVLPGGIVEQAILNVRWLVDCQPSPRTPLLPAAPQREDGEAYILYTSGTKGRPKGVVVENRNVCHYVRAFAEEFHPDTRDVMLQHSVCTFDIFTEEVWCSLLNGASLAIPSVRTKESIPMLKRFMMRNRVTMLSGFPYLLLDFNKDGNLPRSLRLLISGGDVLRASYIDNIVHHNPDVMIYNTYGPSETTVCATYQRCDYIKPLADGTFPIGHTVAGVSIEILDENMQPVADGQQGEICILGDGVSRGYLKECPESANFVTLADGSRLYRSGDLGYRNPDGSIAFLRRKDSQVMILGKRVECDEVENVLCECPEVESGVVRPMTDGHGLSYLVAYVVPKSLGTFSLAKLKEKLSRYLTSFMIPEFFVTLAHMPLTPNGKPDVRSLPQPIKE